MPDNNPLEELESLRVAALGELDTIPDEVGLDAWRVAYLGRSGKLTQVLRSVSALPPAERPLLGAAGNKAKVSLEEHFGARRTAINNVRLDALADDAIDITLPGRQATVGRLHPSTMILREITEIFRGMGFQIVEGPEVERDYYNFEALNIPKDHPARDMFDTFWLDANKDAEGRFTTLLRTHTSPMQIRYLEAHQPPIRVVVPGTCYRYEATDAAHEWMLTQIEGLVIDENISFPHLKGTLESFVHRFLGPGLETRFRCDYFPFVEPGAELSIRWGDRWLEMLGAGMVHPEIIEAAGLDPERYTGFAFGMGVERFAMLRYGIEDIRNFYQNDLRFLQQFRGVS